MNQEIATMNDIRFDSKATLSNDQKKALVNLIEQEFNNKRSLYQRVLQEKKSQLLDEYKNKVSYEKLRADLDTAKAKVTQCEEALALAGLDDDGSIVSDDYKIRRMSEQAKKGYRRIKNLMDAVEEDTDSQTRKAKIIARLWMCRNYAEACIILKDVLGNGIIPSIKKAEL